MPFIVSKDISSEALHILEKSDEVILFETHHITYSAIANHPDIFFTPLGNNTLVYAPNTPQRYINLLQAKGINLIKGGKPVGKLYPETARYNACITSTHIIHNIKYTDTSITGSLKNHKTIQVNQGYTRCNLLPLTNNSFITSDTGIFTVLQKLAMRTLLMNPENITLNGFKNGFFGGCCGIQKNKLFINGSLKHLPEFKHIHNFISNTNFIIIELTPEPPSDIGTILSV